MSQVSIILPAYNVAGHIAAAIASVLAQTHEDWQLIIIDDGSTDATVAVASEAAQNDPRIRIEQLGANGGVAAARNAGLERATGDWITVLDSDDSYEPERLAALIEAAEQTGAELLADNLMLHDGLAGRMMGAAFAFDRPAIDLTRELLLANDGPPRFVGLGHLKPFFSRDLLMRAGCRYPVGICLGEDFNFLFLLLGAARRASLLRYAGYHYALPHSVANGARAAGSRTPYEKTLAEIARSTEQLVAHLRLAAPGDVTQNSALIDLLNQRLWTFHDSAGWQYAMALLRQRRVVAAGATILKLQPDFILKQLRSRYRRKRKNIQTTIAIGPVSRVDAQAPDPRPNRARTALLQQAFANS